METNSKRKPVVPVEVIGAHLATTTAEVEETFSLLPRRRRGPGRGGHFYLLVAI